MDILAALQELTSTLQKNGNSGIARQIDMLVKYAKKTISDKAIERFWNKVKKTPTCWLFSGAKTTSGYGILTIDGRNYQAHKFAWELANKRKVPKGMVLLHKCDVRFCCRPSHLTPGTQQSNVDDRVSKDRSAKGKDNGRARLTDNDIKKIRKLRADGMTEMEIANIFNVGRSTISNICHNRTWQWLT